MATLKIWTDFSKRKNSTKQPTGGTDIEVKLKENTSIENPVFICNNIGNANYCQFGGNYYFVNDVVFVTNSIVELHCSMDALATNKSAIANYTCFVERASTYFDPMIKDEMISQKSTGSYTAGTEQSLSDAIDSTHGLYIVRILGRSGITGYAMGRATLNTLMNFTNDFVNFPDVIQGLDEVVDGAIKGLFNPDKFIVSVKWFPFTSSILDLGNNQNVYLGNWDSGLNLKPVQNPKVVINKTVALPTPIYPNDFRKYDFSWTKLSVYLPCIGSVELDPLRYPNGIGVKYITDLYTGALTVLLADADENVPIQSFTGSIGVDMPVGKSFQNTLGTAGGWGSIIAGGAMAAAGNPLGLGVAFGGAGMAVKASAQPLQTMIGGQGTIATIQEMNSIKIGLFAFDTCENPTTMGKPVMKNMQLGTFTGFVKCGNASLDSGAYGSEKDTINNYLNNGFYME